MYKLDSIGLKENKHVSSPAGSKAGLKNCKTASQTQIAERPGIITKLVGVQKPQGYWCDEIKACPDFATTNFQGSLILGWN